MKVYTWLVETIAIKNDGSIEAHSLEIETIGEHKQEVLDIAKSETKMALKKEGQDFLRIDLCWLELKRTYPLSEYQYFIRLYENKRTRNAIMKILQIPFWKLKQYEDYYNGDTKPLTRKGYLYLKKFLTNERIRRRYNIPKCEFKQFLNGACS